MYVCDVHFYISIFTQCMCLCCTHMLTYSQIFKDVTRVFSRPSAKDEKRKKKERMSSKKQERTPKKTHDIRLCCGNKDFYCSNKQ